MLTRIGRTFNYFFRNCDGRESFLFSRNTQHYFQPQLIGGAFNLYETNDILGIEIVSENSNISSLWNGLWLMAVPKSKKSPGKKRQKHLQHVPDKVLWTECKRCGQPKRPHRICTTNKEICALRESEWNALDKSQIVIKKEYKR
mmetsp:Transcript_27815/g.28062  ORF Transcript_27815/g.28062 Transcript_27815/m.28062 type:complete len:144 (-) Transcript_27815:9-440(-)